MTNTAEFIPVESICPILLQSEDFPEYPYLSGTGFFVHFPPYEDIFFVTARHCTIDDSTGKPRGTVILTAPNNQRIEISHSFQARYDPETIEDIIVYKVDNPRDETKSVALRLQHQDDAETMIRLSIGEKQNLRVVGFPSSDKEYDHDTKLLNAQPRGFYGKIGKKLKNRDTYTFDCINWKQSDLGGFSGSPVLALVPDGSGEVLRIPLGVLILGTSKAQHFLSINLVTNTIANYYLNLSDSYCREIRAALLGISLSSKVIPFVTTDDVSKKWNHLKETGWINIDIVRLLNSGEITEKQYRGFMVALRLQWDD